MRLYLLVTFLAVSGVMKAQSCGVARQLDFIENVEGIDLIKVTSSKELKPIVIDKTRSYSVQEEATELIDHELKHVTCAALEVNMQHGTIISYTDARMRGDTLDILVYDFDESQSNQFQIRVIRDKYKILYDFSYPVDELNRSITTVESTLLLSTGIFKKGAVVRGYVEYTGKCVQACEYVGEQIAVKGNFVALIR
jgi:hypothetical protein